MEGGEEVKEEGGVEGGVEGTQGEVYYRCTNEPGQNRIVAYAPIC